jgi:hypothetical protein
MGNVEQELVTWSRGRRNVLGMAEPNTRWQCIRGVLLSQRRDLLKCDINVTVNFPDLESD